MLTSFNYRFCSSFATEANRYAFLIKDRLFLLHYVEMLIRRRICKTKKFKIPHASKRFLGCVAETTGAWLFVNEPSDSLPRGETQVEEGHLFEFSLQRAEVESRFQSRWFSASFM